MASSTIMSLLERSAGGGQEKLLRNRPEIISRVVLICEFLENNFQTWLESARLNPEKASALEKGHEDMLASILDCLEELHSAQGLEPLDGALAVYESFLEEHQVNHWKAGVESLIKSFNEMLPREGSPYRFLN